MTVGGLVPEKVARPCAACGGSGRELDERRVGPLARERRGVLGLSVREAARRARCSPSFVSNLERGLTRWRGAASKRVLQVLGMDLIADLLPGRVR